MPRIEELVREHFDLRPAAILRDLDLRRPIYAKTAAYGHFGRDDPDFTWERTDKAAALRAAAGLEAAAPLAERARSPPSPSMRRSVVAEPDAVSGSQGRRRLHPVDASRRAEGGQQTSASAGGGSQTGMRGATHPGMVRSGRGHGAVRRAKVADARQLAVGRR